MMMMNTHITAANSSHTTFPEKPPRVLQLCTSNNFGGLEIHFLKFSRWLQQRQKQKTDQSALTENSPNQMVWVATQAESRLAKAIQPALILKGPFWQRLWQLLRFIRQNQINVIHCHHKRDLLLAVLTKIFSHQPITLIHTRHMQISSSKRDPYHAFLYGRLDLFIAITEHMQAQAKRFLPLDAQRIQQLYLGAPATHPMSRDQRIRLRQTLNLTEDTFLVATISRVEQQKGQHILVDAIEQLHKKNQPIHGLIVGEIIDDAYAKSLQQHITQAALPISWLGFRDDVTELIAAADAVCITTRDETFGLIAIEAMMSKCLTIGADSGGITEIITHEKTGLLYKTFDAERLAETIAYAMQNPEQRQAIAQAGLREATQRFNESTQFEKLLKLIRDTCLHQA